LLIGLAPALHTARQDTSSALKDRYDTVTLAYWGRLGRSLVIGQVAVSLTLVAAAGLLARTLHGLTTIDAGFSSDRVVLLAVNPGARGYQRAELASYFNRLSEQFRRLPGIERASLVQFSFLTTARTTGTFNVPGFVPASIDERLLQVFQVGADFFTTMRIPIVEGRDFTDADMTATILPVAINEAAAYRFFGIQDAVGRTMSNEGTGRQFRIIAVVKDGRYNTLRDETSAVIFVPYASSGRNRMTYVVRMAGPEPPAKHLPNLLNEVRAVDPLVPVEGDMLDAVVARSLGQERLLATIAAFFGLAALLLMSLGLYGVMAFWVTARTPEIGVRLALGARRPQVVWGVVRRPLWLVVVGLLVGVGVTMASARLVSNVLFGLAPQDPLTIGGAIVFLVATATIAAALPARRACRIDPVAALRCE
jgi:predicted permease